MGERSEVYKTKADSVQTGKASFILAFVWQLTPSNVTVHDGFGALAATKILEHHPPP